VFVIDDMPLFARPSKAAEVSGLAVESFGTAQGFYEQATGWASCLVWT